MGIQFNKPSFDVLANKKQKLWSSDIIFQYDFKS